MYDVIDTSSFILSGQRAHAYKISTTAIAERVRPVPSLICTIPLPIYLTLESNNMECPEDGMSNTYFLCSVFDIPPTTTKKLTNDNCKGHKTDVRRLWRNEKNNKRNIFLQVYIVRSSIEYAPSAF